MTGSAKRPWASASAAVLAVVALAAPGAAAAQGIDASIDPQNRWPALGRGDLLMVRGTGVVPHLETAIGLDLDLVRRPIVLVDEATEGDRDLVGTRLTGTFLYGLGIGDRTQVTVAVPGIWQEGAGLEGVTRDAADALPRAAAGDVRLDFLWSVLPSPWDRGTVGIGVASGLTLPTGDGDGFAGAEGFGAYLEAIGAGRIGHLVLSGQWGVRLRPASRLTDVRVGTQGLFAVGAAYGLLDDRLVVAAEGQVLVGFVEGSVAPGQGLLEVRVRLGEERAGEIALGVGTGLGQALTTPELSVVAALRFVPPWGGGGRMFP